MNNRRRLLQIIPRAPDDCGGVGDYALQLAGRLRESYDIESTFVSAAPATSSSTAENFELLSPLRTVSKTIDAPGALLLHYVNYGYNPRGIPSRLPTVLRRLTNAGGARLVTIFHELYAAGSWRRSAFWLGPLQKQIARSIADLSDAAIVSNETQGAQLERLAPGTRVSVQPVMSNFGEPALTRADLAGRDPHRWVICGGTELIQRSLHSMLQNIAHIPQPYSPRELAVVGGTDSSEIRSLLDRLPDIKTSYHPRVDRGSAAEVLSNAAFAWLDYFHQPGVATATILKSTVFAAYCAHGVIPVFPHAGSPIALGADRLPGPFFVTESDQSLPSEKERIDIALSHYDWYRRHASSEHLALTVATALRLAA